MFIFDQYMFETPKTPIRNAFCHFSKKKKLVHFKRSTEKKSFDDKRRIAPYPGLDSQ